MGAWEFLRLLIGSKDNPLVRYGARHGGGYVLLSVFLLYLVIGGGVWFFWGMHRDYVASAAVLGGSGLFIVWSGLCFVLFTPRYYQASGLEELWLTRLSGKEIVAGLLTRPLRIILSSFLLPYVLYIYLCLRMDNYFDEVLSGVLMMPLSGTLITCAVFARRWITHLRAGFVYFVSGIFKSCLYLGVATLCSFFLGAFTFYAFEVRHYEVFHCLLWIPFAVFIVLVWRLEPRDLPERLFRLLDADRFAEKNWFIRERDAWRRVTYRKRVSLRQRRFLYPRVGNVVLPLLVFFMFMAFAGTIGYLHHDSCQYSYRDFYWRDYAGNHQQIPASEVLPSLGVINALFSQTTILGLSFLVPLLLVHCITGKKDRDLFFPPGTLLSGLVRLAMQLVVFQVAWWVFGYFVCFYLFPGIPFFRNMEYVIEYLAVHVLFFLPISLGVIMLLIPAKSRRIIGWILMAFSSVMMIFPLLVAKYLNRTGFSYIIMKDDYIISLMVLYSVLVLFLIVAGYNWLGARYYRLLGHERGSG